MAAASRLTKVEPSLHWHEAILTSARHRRLARKWPWSWRCVAEGCDDAYGAARTESAAQAAADEHERAMHGHAAVLLELVSQAPATEREDTTP